MICEGFMTSHRRTTVVLHGLNTTVFKASIITQNGLKWPYVLALLSSFDTNVAVFHLH